MINFKNYIGFPVTKVKEILTNEGYSVEIFDNNSKKDNFDIELVVQIIQQDEKSLKLITNKFLQNI